MGILYFRGLYVMCILQKIQRSKFYDHLQLLGQFDIPQYHLPLCSSHYSLLKIIKLISFSKLSTSPTYHSCNYYNAEQRVVGKMEHDNKYEEMFSPRIPETH